MCSVFSVINFFKYFFRFVSQSRIEYKQKLQTRLTLDWHAKYNYYKGWPKNGTVYFPPQYVDTISGISVYEVTSPEQNDTKISKFGSVVCFLCRILWDNVETQSFPLSA